MTQHQTSSTSTSTSTSTSLDNNNSNNGASAGDNGDISNDWLETQMRLEPPSMFFLFLFFFTLLTIIYK